MGSCPSRESTTIARRPVRHYRALSLLMERGRRGALSPTCIHMYNVRHAYIIGEMRHTRDSDLMWNNRGDPHTSGWTLMMNGAGVRYLSDYDLTMNNFGMPSLDGSSTRDDWLLMEIWPFLSSRGIVILRRFILWGYHLRVPTVFTFRRGHWYCYPWDRWLIVWELYFRNHPESTCRTGHINLVGFIINFWLLFWTLFRSYLRIVLVFMPLTL